MNMKKIITYLTLLAAPMIAGGCGDDSEVFYSISYPVVRIEVDATLLTPDPEEPSEGTETTSDDSEEPVNPLAAQIQAEATAEAPVQVGGRYLLEFTRYNRGPLTLETATQAGNLAGVFFKEPGTSEITLLFLEKTLLYDLTAYTDTDGVRKVLLKTDLTEEFKARYPDAGVIGVTRTEYTSTPAN